MLKNIEIKLPHWISATAAFGVAVFSALAASTNATLIPYEADFAVAATICGAVAAFNLTKRPAVGQ